MVSLQTGIQVSDECINEFTALRMKRAHRYLIMRVTEDKTQVVIEKKGARDETFEQFKESMPKDQGR
jgi:cofilin